MRMLLLLFITIPVIEMWLLIEVGARIGALNTIMLVFLTAVIGLALLRQQGFATLTRLNLRMAEGQLPAAELMEGVALAVGGALLLTPGFFTDAVGFFCLLPFSRRWLVGGLLRQGFMRVAGTSRYADHKRRHGFGQNDPFEPAAKDQAGSVRRPESPHTIEGEFRRDD